MKGRRGRAGTAGPTIVELVGIPGAGKTTKISTVASEFQRAGLTVEAVNLEEKVNRLLDASPNGRRHRLTSAPTHRPLLALRLLLGVLPRPPRQAYGLVADACLRSQMVHRYRQRSSADVVLLDEGVSHLYLWATSHRTSDRGLVSPPRNHCDHVILVEASHETAYNRLQARDPAGVFAGMPFNEARLCFERYERRLEAQFPQAVRGSDAPTIAALTHGLRARHRERSNE